MHSPPAAAQDAVRKELEREAEDEDALAAGNSPPSGCARRAAALGAWLIAWLRWYLLKFTGTPGARPPAVSISSRVQWELAAWSWFGVTVTLLVLSGLNQLTLRLSDERYEVYSRKRRFSRTNGANPGRAGPDLSGAELP